MNSKLAIVGALALSAFLPRPAEAQYLLDDSQINTSGGIINASYSQDAQRGYAMANAVTVGSGGWNINTISTFYGTVSGSPSSVTTTATLLIEPYDSGSYPDDPFLTLTNTVPVTFTREMFTDPANGFSRNTYVMTTTGLNLSLAPGTYWIAMTPLVPTSSAGSLYAWGSSTSLAAPAIWYTTDSGQWGAPFSFWSGPSAMMQIQGTTAAVPEPASFVLAGLGCVFLALCRRRGNRASQAGVAS